MTTLFLYTLKSAFVLTLLYVPYSLFLRREKMHRFNRFTLLGILLLSLVLPLCNVSVLSLDNNPVVHAAQQQMIEVGIPIRQFVVTAKAGGEAGTATLQEGGLLSWIGSLSWFDVVSIVYLLGMAVVLLVRLVQFCRMGLVIRGGSLWRHKEDGVTIYCHADQVAPFSWLRSIVVSEADYQENGREIILHEKGHILSHHSFDVLLLTLVEMLQWWNPICYMLDVSLRDIHEFEADDYVLRQGVSARGYQMLLVKKAVGASSYTFANNFNHSSIINRITMMQKSNSNPWRRSRALCVLPVAVLSLSAFATPEFIKPIEQAVTEFSDKGTQKSADVQVKVEETTPLPAELMVEAVEELQSASVEAEPVQMDEPAQIEEVEAAEVPEMLMPDGDKIFDVVEVLPKFGEGDSELYKFLAQHIRYPKEAQEWAIQGRVFVQFVIKADGSVDQVEIKRSVTKPKDLPKNSAHETVVVGYGSTKKEGETDNPAEKVLTEEIFDKASKALDAECIRVVKLMSGKWTPGKHQGKNVAVRFNLPIVFRLS